MKKVLLCLIALAVGFNAKAAETDYQNWMAGLDDNAFICQLSIPGVRAFDLRPAVIDGKLTICHGILVTSFDFNTIMQQLCTYLDAHPSEFCIVSSRHEVEADDGDSSFGSKMQSSLASFKDHLVNFRPNLTTGDTAPNRRFRYRFHWAR